MRPGVHAHSEPVDKFTAQPAGNQGQQHASDRESQRKDARVRRILVTHPPADRKGGQNQQVPASVQQPDAPGSGVGRHAEKVDETKGSGQQGGDDPCAHHRVGVTAPVAVRSQPVDGIEKGGHTEQPEGKNNQHLVNRMSEQFRFRFHRSVFSLSWVSYKIQPGPTNPRSPTAVLSRLQPCSQAETGILRAKKGAVREQVRPPGRWKIDRRKVHEDVQQHRAWWDPHQGRWENSALSSGSPRPSLPPPELPEWYELPTLVTRYRESRRDWEEIGRLLGDCSEFFRPSKMCLVATETAEADEPPAPGPNCPYHQELDHQASWLHVAFVPRLPKDRPVVFSCGCCCWIPDRCDDHSAFSAISALLGSSYANRVARDGMLLGPDPATPLSDVDRALIREHGSVLLGGMPNLQKLQIGVYAYETESPKCYQTSRSETEFRQILDKVNFVWRQACITFRPLSWCHLREEEVSAEAWRAAVEDRGQPLAAVTAFGNNALHVFFANLPGAGLVVDPRLHLAIMTDALQHGRTHALANAFGQMLGLSFVPGTDQLMSGRRSGYRLSPLEIVRARNAVRKRLANPKPAPRPVSTAKAPAPPAPAPKSSPPAPTPKTAAPPPPVANPSPPVPPAPASRPPARPAAAPKIPPAPPPTALPAAPVKPAAPPSSPAAAVAIAEVRPLTLPATPPVQRPAPPPSPKPSAPSNAPPRPPTLRVPVHLHLVKGAREACTLDAAAATRALEAANQIWEPAGLVFKLAGCAPVPLTDAQVAAVCPHQDSQVRRDPSELVALPVYNPEAVNVFLTRTLPYEGSNLKGQTMLFPAQRLLVVAEEYQELPVAHSLARALGRFLGLRLADGGPADHLLTMHSRGVLLTPEEIQQVRSAWTRLKVALENGPVSQPPDTLSVPVDVVLVRNDAYGSRLPKPDAEERLREVQQVFAPAGLQFQWNVREVAVNNGALESAFPSEAAQAHTRKKDFRGLTALPGYRQDALQMFLLRDIPSVGASIGAEHFFSALNESLRIVLVKEHDEEGKWSDARCLARGLGAFFNLLKNPFEPAERLTSAGPGLLLGQKDVDRLRVDVVRLFPYQGKLPTLELPVRLHLVQAQGWSPRASEQDLQKAFEQAAEIWHQANIRLILQGCQRLPIAQAPVQDACPNAAGVKTERKPSCDALRRLPQYEKSAFNVFVVREVPSVGKAEILNPCAVFASDRLALVAEDMGAYTPAKLLACALGRLLGLPWNRQFSAERLMRPGTAGVRLNAEEIEKARSAVKAIGP